MKNICVFTFGGTWEIIPEILGFLNPDRFPLYRYRKDYDSLLQIRKGNGVEPVSEIWLVTTKGTSEALQKLSGWLRLHATDAIVCREIPTGLTDLVTAGDCEQAREAIFRAVFHAGQEAAGGKVYLSLAGGRKTMSADMQDAGNIFGCSAMLHVISSGKVELPEGEICFPVAVAETITPIVISGERKKAPFLVAEKGILPQDYPLDGNWAGKCLIRKISELQKKAAVLLSNFDNAIFQMERGESFRALHHLHPEIIRRLNEEIVLDDIDGLKWVEALPKAELHCHFGGILSAEEMITVAMSEEERIWKCIANCNEYADWVNRIQSAVDHEEVNFLRSLYTDKAKVRTPIPAIPEPIGVCGFLRCFLENSNLLRKVIYGDRNPRTMCGIGIDEYEKMGDLQGSALMQSETCIRAACRCLKEQCRKSNVLYCEVRCSPTNYTRGGASGEDVARILLDELTHDACQTYFTLIFIASRHGDPNRVTDTVQLAELLLRDMKFRDRLVGFDLAGAEGAAPPNQFRELFDPLLKQCMRITIHAGETEDVENIWDAVYSLNADRIGHGLNLAERPELMNRFLDRRIAVELCPSSNFQIVGFEGSHLGCPGKSYPLREFLDCGLRVTINTDDPGISDTNLNREYLKATDMTKGGLSKWDTIRLVYNGFSASFSSYDIRRKILLQAEDCVMKMIGEWYGN
ncbi:MAG: hypothetical protein J6Z49_00260 [Kiritimatiellae bacterium]|nr:hypothetical protein [Kiritimatiellia bacterium]